MTNGLYYIWGPYLDSLATEADIEGLPRANIELNDYCFKVSSESSIEMFQH